MGSFSKKRKKSTEYDKLIANSLKPASLYTPYGNLVDGEYEPVKQAVIIEPYKLYGGSNNV